MKPTDNKGFDPQVIGDFRSRIKASGVSYLEADAGENTDEYVHFYFLGKYEGKPVVYDAVLCTLRFLHESDMFEIAEHRAARHFPQYKKINYQEDENGNLAPLDELEEQIGLFMAEVILELEEEGEVRVQEKIELDSKIDLGIGLDAGLNVGKLSPKVIEKFIREFNDDTLVLDDTLYSFQTQHSEDEV